MDYLPAETVEQIITQLAPDDMVRMSQTSRHYNQLVWQVIRDFYISVWGEAPDIEKLEAFFKLYRSLYYHYRSRTLQILQNNKPLLKEFREYGHITTTYTLDDQVTLLFKYVCEKELDKVAILLILDADPNWVVGHTTDDPDMIAILYHYGLSVWQGSDYGLASYLWHSREILGRVDSILHICYGYNSLHEISHKLQGGLDKYNYLNQSHEQDLTREITTVMAQYYQTLEDNRLTEDLLDILIKEEIDRRTTVEPLQIIIDMVNFELFNGVIKIDYSADH